jgi:Family of unknown function (DUF6152)
MRAIETSKTRATWALIAGLVCAASPATAHHSTAIYDSDNPIELAGTVVEWQFVNPHCFIMLEVTDSDGTKRVWSLEGGNTAGLFRRGWTPNTLKAGDEIVVTVRPLRSGSPGGNYSNPRWTDGSPIDPKPGGGN